MSWADWKEEQARRDMEVGELRAEIERLRTALQPFASALDEAEKIQPEEPDGLLTVCREAVTLYEFARARNVLEHSRLRGGRGD